MAEVFDIDARAAIGYEPLAVRLRGKEYLFGARAVTLVRVGSIRQRYLLTAAGEPLQDAEAQAALYEHLYEIVQALCPDFDIPEAELTVGEQLGLLQASTEVLRRIAHISFRQAESD